MKNALSKYIMGLTLAAHLTIAFGNDCVSVYMNATRNIEENEKQLASLNYYYHKHCQVNGEINESSLSVGLEAVVKQIPYKFSLESGDSRKKLEEFCKTGFQKNAFSLATSSYKSEVVVAALNSFNQCIAIQNKGILLTHIEQPPKSVIISGAITNNFTKANLDMLAYDSKDVTCTSTGFTNKGSEIVLDGSRSLPITKNFAIKCVRTSKKEGDKTYYPRATIGVATSVGLYNVELLEDELYGFMLASQARKNYDNALYQRDDALAQKDMTLQKANTLEARLANADVEIRLASTGEYHQADWSNIFPREYCYEELKPEFTQGKCPVGSVAKLHLVRNHGGNKCGYKYFVITCLKK